MRNRSSGSAAAVLLAELATRHGIGSVQLGADSAELVVAMEEGRTYFDLAELEAELEALLRRRLQVTSAGAPGAHRWEKRGSLGRAAPRELSAKNTQDQLGAQGQSAPAGGELLTLSAA